jgi:hypothetical protein
MFVSSVLLTREKGDGVVCKAHQVCKAQQSWDTLLLHSRKPRRFTSALCLTGKSNPASLLLTALSNMLHVINGMGMILSDAAGHCARKQHAAKWQEALVTVRHSPQNRAAKAARPGVSRRKGSRASVRAR